MALEGALHNAAPVFCASAQELSSGKACDLVETALRFGSGSYRIAKLRAIQRRPRWGTPEFDEGSHRITLAATRTTDKT
jgi:hypothetical protein